MPEPTQSSAGTPRAPGAGEAERAEAAAVLEGVMGEVEERECPSGALKDVCRAARAGIAGASPPWAGLATRAGLDAAALSDGAALPADDRELWLRLAIAVVGNPAGGPTAELELTHWLCVTAALTLWGPGTQADAPALAAYVAESEEGAADLASLETAFTPVVESWLALGALNGTERLTALGWWGVPEAQRRAWMA